MIAFLLPAAVGLAALAAVPLAIHWLTRQRARPLAFRPPGCSPAPPADWRGSTACASASS